MRPLALLALVALLATACGGSTGGDPTGPAAPGDGGGSGDGEGGPIGSWELTTASPTIDVPEGARITLTVERLDGEVRAGGTAACNHYGGTVQAGSDGTWSIAEVVRTMIGCEQPAMDAESAYLATLEGVEHWTRSDSTLTLSGDGVELTFQRVAEVETAALTGTTWELDSIVHGTGPDGSVSSTTTGVEPAVLRLDDDGTLTLFTGCRDFAGEWTARGDEVVLPSLGEAEGARGVDRGGALDCGADAEAQERDVLAVVQTGVRATVDGRRLTLTHGEQGLVLRAVEGLDASGE